MIFKAELKCKLKNYKHTEVSLFFGGDDYDIITLNQRMIFLAQRVQADCQPYKLIVWENSDCFILNDLKFGKNSQIQLGDEGISCSVFSFLSTMQELEFEELHQEQQVTIYVTRIK